MPNVEAEWPGRDDQVASHDGSDSMAGLDLAPVARVVRRRNRVDGTLHDRIESINAWNPSEHLHESLFTEAQVRALLAAERERCAQFLDQMAKDYEAMGNSEAAGLCDFLASGVRA